MNPNNLVIEILRYVLYAAIVAGLVMLIRHDAGIIIEGRKFIETSFTEVTQKIFVVLTAVLFMSSGRILKDVRGVAYFIGGGFVVVLVREMDALLDVALPGGWAPLAMAVTIVTLIVAYRNRAGFGDSIRYFMATPAFGLFAAGGLSVFIFSRLFGAKGTWEAVFGLETLDPASRGRWVKNAVEEGSELFGYCLILFAAIELFILARRRRQG